MDSRIKTVLNRAGPRALDGIQKFFLTDSVVKAERRGTRLGLLAFRIDRKHRERTISNLELAFPDWSPEARLDVARQVFRHFGLVAGDFLRSPIRTDAEVLEGMEVEGFEHYQQADELGKGIIAVTAHLGNWERFAHWLMASGREIAVVARDANQSEIQDRVSKIREASRVTVLSRGDSAREILQRLRRKEIIGLLPDQNSEESFVPFFGQPCGSVLGPAILHQRTGAALLPAYCVRLAPGRYRVVLRPLVDPENQEKDATLITAQLNAILESVIREYPDQYLWMHDRWKSARQRSMLSEPTT